MAAQTYKCPNCGGSMVFDPEKQRFVCEYCLSDFQREDLDRLSSDGMQEEPSSADLSAEEKEPESALLYTCPSCGAEIAMEGTTVSDFCYYCHNPVILSGKLSKEQMPSLVIPFQFSKDDAKERFLSWIGRKTYLPRDFFSAKQIEKLSGVYFPYWTCDRIMHGSLSGTARRIRMWRAGDMEYTETKVYSVRRAGQIELRDLSRNALQKAQVRMLDGILPFDLQKAEPFHTGFLSGFQAEVKDMERECFKAEIEQETEGYVRELLTGTASTAGGFQAERFCASEEKSVWRYVLLPVWILTYRRNGALYYFAMNGQTGEICGRLPIDYRKLAAACAGLFLAVTASITLLGGLLL